MQVGGASIVYSAWGKVGLPGLLFIHGGRAHRNWWRPFAPFLSEKFRVAALDLSGMGDSDWRQKYSLDQAVDELMAVVEAAKLNVQSRPIMIGHSFGGFITLAAVEREGEKLGGAVVIDSPMMKPDPNEGYKFINEANSQLKVPMNRLYKTIEEPISRFRLLPEQPSDELYLLDYIARTGLTDKRETPLRAAGSEPGEGWSWKFDPTAGMNFEISFDRNLFLAARCPLAFIYGTESAFNAGDGIEMHKKQFVGRAPFIEIPGSRHHLMMDAPIAFISTLRTLLSCWPVRIGL